MVDHRCTPGGCITESDVSRVPPDDLGALRNPCLAPSRDADAATRGEQPVRELRTHLPRTEDDVHVIGHTHLGNIPFSS